MLKSTNQPLSEAYKLALLDLDGVVYRGKNPVEHAAENIRKAESSGMTVEYTTNNSSRLQAVVADQLKGFDLEVEPWQVITSSVVAARMVARAVPEGSKVFVLGAQHLREEVSKQGLEVVDRAEEQPVAAIQGWYPDMSWNEMAQIAYAVEHGATYFVTNRDLTIPRELGIAPGCGSMIMAVINATGVVLTKLDGTPRGGCAVSVWENLGLPIRFIGVGEKIDDLMEFDAQTFVESLLPESALQKEEQKEEGEGEA